MNNNTSAPPEVGATLQRLRLARGLTLEDLSRIAGVSKSMLSQIERGQANPSLATVWSLASALRVDISELISGHASDLRTKIEVASASFTPEIKTDDGLCTLRILSPPDHAEAFEWYELLFQPQGSLDSKPHAKGMREHLTVLEGDIQVKAGADLVDVPQGGTARYAADVEHSIRNIGNGPARALLVMTP